MLALSIEDIFDFAGLLGDALRELPGDE